MPDRNLGEKLFRRDEIDRHAQAWGPIIVGPGNGDATRREEAATIVKRLTGLPGSQIPTEGGSSRVEARTLLGRPGTGGHDPGYVIWVLARRARGSISDRANLACAFAWRGYDRWLGGDGARAKADLDDALAEITEAKAMSLDQSSEEPGATVEELHTDIAKLGASIGS